MRLSMWEGQAEAGWAVDGSEPQNAQLAHHTWCMTCHTLAFLQSAKYAAARVLCAKAGMLQHIWPATDPLCSMCSTSCAMDNDCSCKTNWPGTGTAAAQLVPVADPYDQQRW